MALNETLLDWEHPTQEMQAALRLARKHTPARMSAFAAAEFIVGAAEAKWLEQASRWIMLPPPGKQDNVPWIGACQFLVELVNSGYDATRDLWWPLDRISNVGIKMLMFLDFVMQLREYRQENLLACAYDYDAVADLLRGRGWEHDYLMQMEMAAQALQRGAPTENVITDEDEQA